jgi:hypothetical protein
MPNAKHREPIVPLKVKKAVEVLLGQSIYDLAAAAKEAGLSTYWLRRYMKRPEVIRYMREERQALIEEVCAGNPMALARVRDSSENGMAVVAAVRQAELLRQNVVDEAGGVEGRLPGLQIVIVQPGVGKVLQEIGPATPMIEASVSELTDGA